MLVSGWCISKQSCKCAGDRGPPFSPMVPELFREIFLLRGKLCGNVIPSVWDCNPEGMSSTDDDKATDSM